MSTEPGAGLFVPHTPACVALSLQPSSSGILQPTKYFLLTLSHLNQNLTKPVTHLTNLNNNLSKQGPAFHFQREKLMG